MDVKQCPLKCQVDRQDPFLQELLATVQDSILAVVLEVVLQDTVKQKCLVVLVEMLLGEIVVSLVSGLVLCLDLDLDLGVSVVLVVMERRP